MLHTNLISSARRQTKPFALPQTKAQVHGHPANVKDIPLQVLHQLDKAADKKLAAGPAWSLQTGPHDEPVAACVEQICPKPDDMIECHDSRFDESKGPRSSPAC